MSSDLVLVTGASGYVAGHCILRPLTDGYKVRGTLRPLQRAGEVRQWLTKARGEFDPGDALSFVEAELTASKGWDGATRSAVERVVQTSSSTAILYGSDDPNAYLFTEADWTNPNHVAIVSLVVVQFQRAGQRGGRIITHLSNECQPPQKSNATPDYVIGIRP
jgi:NAD(P)-dependent dehydrogenase (short-subunit alcohol dehydrogenase family)